MASVTLSSDEDTVRRLEAKVQAALSRLQYEWNNIAKNMYRLEFRTQKCFDDELLRGIEDDVSLMMAACVCMGLFCAVARAKKDEIRS